MHDHDALVRAAETAGKLAQSRRDAAEAFCDTAAEAATYTRERQKLAREAEAAALHRRSTMHVVEDEEGCV